MESAMKSLLLTTAILGLLAVPAFASEHEEANGEVDEIIGNGETMNGAEADHDDGADDAADDEAADDDAGDDEEHEDLADDEILRGRVVAREARGVSVQPGPQRGETGAEGHGRRRGRCIERCGGRDFEDGVGHGRSEWRAARSIR